MAVAVLQEVSVGAPVSSCVPADTVSYGWISVLLPRDQLLRRLNSFLVVFRGAQSGLSTLSDSMDFVINNV